MKKIYTYAIFCTGLSLLACNKDIVEVNDNYRPLEPAKLDLEAGDWKPFFAGTYTDYPLPEPEAVSSAAYQNELKELKAASASLTNDQREVINYWKVGSVLRWNEIMRELVAKHNLPPYQNSDGTYPAPSAANPFAYPQFPFSNPPYAARAYAYFSVAQYDALIMAWKFKARYNRQAPYKVDGSIQVSVPKSDLPSYPSEDAVISGAAFELMKLLFPADIAYVTRKAEEEKNYRLWSGANVKSDIVAGDSLGRWVARKIVQQARTDGMGTAGGNATVWKQFEIDCKARGETPWFSLETPARPPMLCLFGNVKPLLFSAASMPSMRATPPPAVNSDKMQQELDEILNFIKNPTKEHTRIVNFWADGVGTYTPPGHWNAIAAAGFLKTQSSEVRWARNYAMLNAAMMDAAIVCWNTKYFYFNPRPSQLNPAIKTLTGVPNFPAYISGHSTFSGAAATVLGFLVPELSAEYEAMALEASNSRMYGGIHYRSDCEQGLVAGRKIGNLAINRAKADAN